MWDTVDFHPVDEMPFEHFQTCLLFILSLKIQYCVFSAKIKSPVFMYNKKSLGFAEELESGETESILGREIPWGYRGSPGKSSSFRNTSKTMSEEFVGSLIFSSHQHLPHQKLEGVN